MELTKLNRRVCVAMKDGSTVYLHKDAVCSRRDEHGQLFVVMKTTKSKSWAWSGPAEVKDEIITSMHAKMAIGFCPQVSYLY